MPELTVKQIKDRILLVENQYTFNDQPTMPVEDWFKQDQVYLRKLYKLLKDKTTKEKSQWNTHHLLPTKTR